MITEADSPVITDQSNPPRPAEAAGAGAGPRAEGRRRRAQGWAAGWAPRDAALRSQARGPV